MEISAENAEIKAIELYKLSYKLGEAMTTVDTMARLNWQAIKDEPTAYETLILDGENVVNALRTLAMRLDRSVLCKIDN